MKILEVSRYKNNFADHQLPFVTEQGGALRAAENGLHCNWLSFISHLLRTSYLQEPMWHGTKNLTAEDQAFLAKTATDLMLFRKRKEVYKTMIDGEFARRMGVNYDDIRPNYLLYSTLGRADLIRFESYLQNRQEGEIG